jgi:hypothetical protein
VQRDRPRSTTPRRAVATTAALVVVGVAVPAVGASTIMEERPEPATAAPHDDVAARAAERRRDRSIAHLRRAERERTDRIERERAARAQAAAKEQQLRNHFLFAVAAHQAAQRAELERIVAARAAAAERAAARRSSGGAPALSGLRRCESGGDYGAVNSTGTYRGAYQFSRSTWNSVASRSFPHLVGVDPAAAAPADQDAMAHALYASSGRSPWPVCGRHL